jgi:hypothetical protein
LGENHSFPFVDSLVRASSKEQIFTNLGYLETAKMVRIGPNEDVILTFINGNDVKQDPETSFDATLPKQTRFKVSSKHLALSSPYVMKRREPNRPEGRKLALDGVVEIKTNDLIFKTLFDYQDRSHY